MAFKADTGQSLVLSAPASGTVTLQAGGSDAMFIDASQNVSIGNTNPQTPFHVTGNVRIDGDLDVNGTTTTIDTETQLTDQLIITNAGTGPAIEANQTGAQPIVDFQDDGVSAFYIENGGNVGINMTDPVYKLDVRRTSLNAAGLAGVVSLRTDAKTASDGITLSFNALDSLDNDTEYAAIGVVITDPVNGSEDGDIVFRNVAAGSVGERMRLDSTGNLGIGATSGGERLLLSGSTTANARAIFSQTTAGLTGQVQQGSTGFAIAANGAQAMLLETNGTERVRITSDGRVGIGTSTASDPLHIKESSSTACRLVLENTGTTSPTNNQIWSQNNDIVLRANGSDGFRLNSAGAISTGGETSPDVDAGGLCLNHGSGDGNAFTLKNSDIAHGITTVAQDDTYGILKKSATTTGGLLIRGLTEDIRALELTAVGTNTSTSDTGSGTIVFDSNKKSGTGQTSLANDENIISIQNNTVAKAVVKGNGDVALQGGIKLGGSGEYLSTYDEGTWTPVIADASTGGNTATFTNNLAVYTRIGRQVTVHYDFTSINTSGMTGANPIYIRGLNDTAGASVHSGNLRTDNVTVSDLLIHRFSSGTSYFDLVEATTGSPASTIKVSDLTSGSAALRGTFTYYV